MFDIILLKCHNQHLNIRLHQLCNFLNFAKLNCNLNYAFKPETWRLLLHVSQQLVVPDNVTMAGRSRIAVDGKSRQLGECVMVQEKNPRDIDLLKELVRNLTSPASTWQHQNLKYDFYGTRPFKGHLGCQRCLGSAQVRLHRCHIRRSRDSSVWTAKQAEHDGKVACWAAIQAGV